MRASRIIAFDLGAERVAAGVFATGATGRIVLERYANEPLHPERTAGDSWADEAARAIGALVARERWRGRAVIGLPGHVTRTKFIVTPAVAPARRGSVLAFEAAQSFPNASNELVWDSVVLSDDGLDLRAIQFAARQAAVDTVCAASERAGIQVVRVVPAAFALLQGFRYNQPERSESTLLVNVGARSTHVVLVADVEFNVRTFALGSEIIPRAIAEELGIEFARAQTLQWEILGGRCTLPEDSPARESARRAGEAFTAKLELELARTVLHLRRQSGRAKPELVYLTGGGVGEPELATRLSAKLGVAVELYDALRRVEIAADARAAGADDAAGRLAALVGLGVGELAGGEPKVNLLPATAVVAMARWRATARWYVAAAALVLGLLGPIFWYGRAATLQQEEIARVDAEVRPWRALDARHRASAAELENVQQRIDRLRPAYDARASWAAFLQDLQMRLARVEDVWLDTLELEPRTPEQSQRLRLSGRLLDVANPQARVSRESEQRVKQLLESFAASPFIATVEQERFDDGQLGVLQFDFVLVLNAARPL